MRLRSKRSKVAIGLGVVAALAVVAPALGGPSLRELVRQEVAKQLDESGKATTAAKKKARRGPPGPQGPQGAAGAQGAVGPAGATGLQGPGALKLDYDQPETDDQIRTVGTVNELTIAARCISAGGLPALDVYATSSGIAGTVDFLYTNDDNGGSFSAANVSRSLPADALHQAIFVRNAISPGQFSRGHVVGAYRNANRVITLQLFSIADDTTTPGRCKVQGTAIPSS